MTQLRSKNNQIVVSRVHKVALSSYDDKRYLFNDGIHSLAYGHYKGTAKQQWLISFHFFW